MRCVLCRHGPSCRPGFCGPGGRPTFCWPALRVIDGGGYARVILRLSARLREHVWPPVMGLLGRGGVPEREG